MSTCDAMTETETSGELLPSNLRIFSLCRLVLEPKFEDATTSGDLTHSSLISSLSSISLYNSSESDSDIFSLTDSPLRDPTPSTVLLLLLPLSLSRSGLPSGEVPRILSMADCCKRDRGSGAGT